MQHEWMITVLYRPILDAATEYRPSQKFFGDGISEVVGACIKLWALESRPAYREGQAYATFQQYFQPLVLIIYIRQVAPMNC